MRYILVLLLFLIGCTIETCQHDNSFRRFVIVKNQSMYGNLLCRDCGARVVSWSYCHPFRGPPEGFQDDDEIIRIGFSLEETLDPIEVPK